MDIPSFIQLSDQFNLKGKINGVIHIGAHEGGESIHYANLGIENVIFVETVEVEARTIDSISKVHTEEYNFLNIDIEGCELIALKGATETLKKIDYILVETQDEYRLDGSCLRDEVVSFLNDWDFELVKYFDTGKKWVDCFFIKRK